MRFDGEYTNTPPLNNGTDGLFAAASKGTDHRGCTPSHGMGLCGGISSSPNPVPELNVEYIQMQISLVEELLDDLSIQEALEDDFVPRGESPCDGMNHPLAEVSRQPSGAEKEERKAPKGLGMGE